MDRTLIDNYIQARQAILDHVGYDGDDEGRLVDYTQYYWYHNYSTVRYSIKSKTILNHLLIDTIHHSKVYEGDDFTLLVLDMDITLEFAIFDNDKAVETIDG